MTINLEKFRSPQSLFIVYVVFASVLIMIFRMIFPGSEAPLVIYARNWLFVKGVLEVFNFFPALVFSALVIPFGLASFEENHRSFSELFFKRLSTSVIVAIAAAIVYGIIFFLALPMVKNYEENMRFSGELYRLARTKAFESRDAGEWYEASQFLGICDRIWFNSPELAGLRDDIAINLETFSFNAGNERNAALAGNGRSSDVILLTENLNGQEMNAALALSLSETAYNEERYFDSHWLANLGVRLSQNGSVQQANATRLSSRAWNMIASQAPNSREVHLAELYNTKLLGYRAMDSERWIQAYYIFLELLSLTPDDPDVRNFLAASEQGAKQIAFFVDEMEFSLGQILNDPVFSLPSANGRAVLRFSSLTTSDDVAYGIGFEYMNFDSSNNLRESVVSRYAKLLPFTLNEKPQVLVMMHALDRYNEAGSYEAEWLIGDPAAGVILLDVSYEDFLLIAHIRRGLTNLQIDELFTAAEKLNNAGYIQQVFQAEILNRIASAVFFLPMAIFVIVFAWRYRAKTKPRYLFVLLLPVLPIVFHGFVFLYRSLFNTLGIWLVLSLGFTAALVVYIVTLAVTLFVSLVVLAAQHS